MRHSYIAMTHGYANRMNIGYGATAAGYLEFQTSTTLVMPTIRHSTTAS
jgi:hypothetical protein